LLVILLGAAACESDEPPVVPPDYGSATAPRAWSAKPIDRLAPGELAPGKADAFGLVLPRKLRVKARFPRSVHASGRASPEAVANYIRQRVTVAHVELAAASTVFPRATIPGGPPDKVYRIEVSPDRGGGTNLVVRDITRAPAPEGLSEEERWRRAGLTPDGKIIDMKSLE
jgi:hypothetical protein